MHVEPPNCLIVFIIKITFIKNKNKLKIKIIKIKSL